MKRALLLCCLAVLALCFCERASAQYASRITRDGTDLVDNQGRVLSDQDIVDLVGYDIYDQTVVGARRQMYAGAGLIYGGAAGIGVGLVTAVVTGVVSGKRGYPDLSTAIQQDPGVALLYLTSVGVTSLGVVALSGGIVFQSIGRSRLDWVTDRCNRSGGASVNWTFVPGGAGISLRF